MWPAGKTWKSMNSLLWNTIKCSWFLFFVMWLAPLFSIFLLSYCLVQDSQSRGSLPLLLVKENSIQGVLQRASFNIPPLMLPCSRLLSSLSYCIVKENSIQGILERVQEQQSLPSLCVQTSADRSSNKTPLMSLSFPALLTFWANTMSNVHIMKLNDC